MERYYILFKDRPKWFPFNIVLHRVLKSDMDGIHDHPWPWATYILKGGYWETQPANPQWANTDGLKLPPLLERVWRPANSFRYRSATAYHRLELDTAKAGGDTWTLFLMGPQIREWGFLNEFNRWEKYDLYLNRKKSEFKTNHKQKEIELI